MQSIKIRYYIIIAIIIILTSIVELKIYNSIDAEKWDRILQVFAGVVALISGVIALAVTDKKSRQVNFDIQVHANKTKLKEEYKKDELDNTIKYVYKDYSEIFYSYQVYFDIIYKSKFSLEEPTLTFRLPQNLRHPNKQKNQTEYRTNIYNEQNKIQKLEFGNTCVISSSNLPYLNEDDTFKIWIRMCLDADSDKKVNIKISLNGKNADGKTITLKKSHKDLFSKE